MQNTFRHKVLFIPILTAFTTHLDTLRSIMTHAMTPKPSSRVTRAGWGEPVLTAQNNLLSLHSQAFTHTAAPKTLPNGHTVNLVIAKTDKRTASDSVLLLFHGWGSGLAFFSRTLPYLVPHFAAVYLADLPGMGASSRPEFPQSGVEGSLDYFISDLDAFYEVLYAEDSTFRKAKNRILAAHSMGAYVSVEWMLRHQRFEKLILISPVGVPARPEPNSATGGRIRRSVFAFLGYLWEKGVTPQSFLQKTPQPFARRMIRGYIQNRYFGECEEGEEDLMVAYSLALAKSPVAGEKAVSTLLQPGAWAYIPLESRLGGIEVPTTFVYGERDWMDWKAGERARKGMGVRTRLERVSGADHNVFVDNAKGFAKVVVDAVKDFEDGAF